VYFGKIKVVPKLIFVYYDILISAMEKKNALTMKAEVGSETLDFIPKLTRLNSL
jgi:hypothetical protein